MPVLSLKDSETARNAITKQQQKQIKKLYRDVAKDIAKEAKSLKGKTNVSSIMRTQYLQTLEKQITVEINKISTELHQITKSGMTQVAQAVTDESLEWLSKIGFSTKGLLSNVPANVVRNIATGQVYTTGWSLSQRIWGIEQKTLQDIHTVIAKGVAKNASVYEIAKDLEKYVDPSAAKKWDWNKVYPGTSRKIDYNAQRLARTLTQHAFQQATKECNDPNPFVDGYIWHSAMIHGRTCSTCMERDGQFFAKEEVPMDHPQGLCTILPHVGRDLSFIANRIADWTEAPEGTYPEIDRFASFIGYKPDTPTKTNTIEPPQKVSNPLLPREKSYIEQPFHYEEVPDYVKGVGKEAYDKTVTALAKKYKLSFEEAQKRLDDAFTAMVDNSDFGIRINSDNLMKALDSGYFKNQHETGMSGGYFGPKVRLRRENILFNVPTESGAGMLDADRPVYGMLVPKFNNSELVKNYYTNGPGNWYGDGVTVILKRENVINQSTLTIGDSFDYGSKVQAMLASNPKCTGSFDYKKVNALLMDVDTKDAKNVTESFVNLTSGTSKKHNTYIEAQLHGKQSHSIENIQTVFLDKSKSSQYVDLVEKLEKQKIPYEWIE